MSNSTELGKADLAKAAAARQAGDKAKADAHLRNAKQAEVAHRVRKGQ